MLEIPCFLIMTPRATRFRLDALDQHLAVGLPRRVIPIEGVSLPSRYARFPFEKRFEIR
jgi:hypothetical protein